MQLLFIAIYNIISKNKTAVATLAVVLPAFAFVLLLIKVLKKALNSKEFKSAFCTLKPCIAGIILATGIFMALKNITGPVQSPVFDYKTLILTAVLGLIYFGSKRIVKKGISPILLILISGVLGIIIKVF